MTNINYYDENQHKSPCINHYPPLHCAYNIFALFFPI